MSVICDAKKLIAERPPQLFIFSRNLSVCFLREKVSNCGRCPAFPAISIIILYLSFERIKN